MRRGGQRRCASGDTTTHDDDFETLLLDVFPRPTAEPILPGRQLNEVILGKNGRGFPGKVNRIATAVETGQVFQFDRDGLRPEALPRGDSTRSEYQRRRRRSATSARTIREGNVAEGAPPVALQPILFVEST